MHRKGIRSAAIVLLLGGSFLVWGGRGELVKASGEATVDSSMAGICISLDHYYECKENAQEELSRYLTAQRGEQTETPDENTVFSEGYRMLRQLGLDDILLGAKAETYAILNRFIDRSADRVEHPAEEPTQTPTQVPTEAPTQAPTEAPTQAPTEAPTEAPTQAPSPYENVAVTEITIVDSFVNVRTAPSTVTGEVIGRIYNHCAATILDRVQGEGGMWYYMESGSVKGYIKADYFVTGDEAEALAVKIGKIFARVDAGGLRLRETPTLEDDNIITNLWEGEIYAVKEIVESDDQFVHITLGKDDQGNDVSGYVAKQYVTVFVEFDTAKSLGEIAAEEAAKKAAAEAAEEARRKAEEERRAAEEAAQRAQQAAEEEARRKAEEEARKAAEAAAMAERNSLVNYAKQFLGVPYVWGGESLTYGVDCSGFTMLVYGHYGYSLPHYSVYQANCGTRVSLDQIRPGDMLFYARNGVVYHVAIYIGNGQMIHAANESLGVTISSINYADIYCAVSIMP